MRWRRNGFLDDGAVGGFPRMEAAAFAARPIHGVPVSRFVQILGPFFGDARLEFGTSLASLQNALVLLGVDIERFLLGFNGQRRCGRDRAIRLRTGAQCVGRRRVRVRCGRRRRCIIGRHCRRRLYRRRSNDRWRLVDELMLDGLLQAVGDARWVVVQCVCGEHHDRLVVLTVLCARILGGNLNEISVYVDDLWLGRGQRIHGHGLVEECLAVGQLNDLGHRLMVLLAAGGLHHRLHGLLAGHRLDNDRVAGAIGEVTQHLNLAASMYVVGVVLQIGVGSLVHF